MQGMYLAKFTNVGITGIFVTEYDVTDGPAVRAGVSVT